MGYCVACAPVWMGGGLPRYLEFAWVDPSLARNHRSDLGRCCALCSVPRGIEWELDKSYLLSRGLYAYSRNPMYLSELILMLGWVIFYGSTAVLIAFAVGYAFFNFYIVPTEERILEAHFGESYLEHKHKVPP